MNSRFGRSSLVGRVIAGRYQVQELLGEGGSGEVYVADHVDVGRRYALKVLKETVEADHTMVERFRREARAAGRLDHPNVVYISDFGRMEDGRLYLVMEYVPGGTLKKAIVEAPGGKLVRPRALSILRQTADALCAAHGADVVHRDIKPANILLAPDPAGGDRVKILDFGLAKIMIESELTALTAQGEMFGTPAYMSPEQARGDPIDHRTDLYALGVVGFELLTGRLPFVAKSLPRMMLAHQQDPVPDPQTLLGPQEPPLPEPLVQAVLACLAKRAEERPASAIVVVDAIDGLDQSQHSATVTIPIVQDPDAIESASTLTAKVAGAEADPERASTVAVDPAVAVMTVLEHSPESNARRDWALEQAGVVGRAMADQMVQYGWGDARLQAVLNDLAQLDQQQIGMETQLAVYRSRLEEQEQRCRQRIAQLRHAVTDLSYERGRLADAGGADPSALSDIDFQIGELEQRLGEVSREEESDQHRIVAGMQTIQNGLGAHRHQVRETERTLVSQLYRLRPNPCPPQLLREYDALDLLMKAAFGA